MVQPRSPRGIPTGGQFAPVAAVEADTELEVEQTPTEPVPVPLISKEQRFDPWRGVPTDWAEYGVRRQPGDPRALQGKRGIPSAFRRLWHHARFSFGGWPYRVAGTPADGRFDPNYHWLPDRELTAQEDQENDHASFYQPPHPMSAVQVADFWVNVEVPPEVVDEVAESHRITPSLARMVVRCHNLRLSSSRLTPPAEAMKVRSLGVTFPDGSCFRPEDALNFHLGYRQTPGPNAGPVNWA